MRLPGFGAAGGDMYLLFRVQIPKTELDETSQKLLQQFLEKNPYDARSDTPWR
jgi:DnaJ-class molecular chaperone